MTKAIKDAATLQDELRSCSFILTIEEANAVIALANAVAMDYAVDGIAAALDMHEADAGYVYRVATETLASANAWAAEQV